MAIAAAGVIVALAIPASASAGILVVDGQNCDTQQFAQPFLPWADLATYTLSPGGSFEPRSPKWTLDGATVVGGNEPFNVTSGGDRRSLSIPDGASATSRAICVGIEHPDLRFFARASSPAAQLNVEVLFEDALGDVQSRPIGTLSGNTGWALTPPYAVVANLLPLLPGSHTAIAFRFSASGGDFAIDDLYVDPYARW
jgi:hypothetical protein